MKLKASIVQKFLIFQRVLSKRVTVNSALIGNKVFENAFVF